MHLCKGKEDGYFVRLDWTVLKLLQQQTLQKVCNFNFPRVYAAKSLGQGGLQSKCDHTHINNCNTKSQPYNDDDTVPNGKFG